jgi:putative ABC transport system permease protein
MRWTIVTDLAFRNIKRNKRRTALSITAISLAAMVIVFMFSIIEGLKYDLSNNLFRYVTGMLRVRHMEYDEFEKLNPLHLRVEDYPEVINTLSLLGDVEEQPETLRGVSVQYSPRIRFLGTMYKRSETRRIIRLEDDMYRVMGLGVDFAREEAYQKLTTKLQAGGRLPQAGQEEVLLSTGLARDLDVGAGDTVVLLTYDMQQEMQLKSFKVTGLISFPVQGMSKLLCLMPIDRAQQLLNMGNSATEVLLLLNEGQGDLGRQPDRLAALAAYFEQELHRQNRPQLIVRAWTQAGTWYSLLNLAENTYNFIALFFFILGTTVIINTTMMVIFERMREIGTIAALGMTGQEIVLLFFLEAFFISALASFAGVLIGIGITIPVSIVGLDFSKAMQGVSLEISPVFYPVINLRSTVIVFFYSVFVASLASYFPSRRAARIEPVKALRSV